jgi:hypothetical protein
MIYQVRARIETGTAPNCRRRLHGAGPEAAWICVKIGGVAVAHGGMVRRL